MDKHAPQLGVVCNNLFSVIQTLYTVWTLWIMLKADWILNDRLWH